MYRTQSVGGSVSSSGDLTGWAIVDASKIMQAKKINKRENQTQQQFKKKTLECKTPTSPQDPFFPGHSTIQMVRT